MKIPIFNFIFVKVGSQTFLFEVPPQRNHRLGIHPRIPRIPRKWCQEPQFRPSLTHAQESSDDVSSQQTPSNHDSGQGHHLIGVAPGSLSALLFALSFAVSRQFSFQLLRPTRDLLSCCPCTLGLHAGSTFFPDCSPNSVHIKGVLTHSLELRGGCRGCVPGPRSQTCMQWRRKR